MVNSNTLINNGRQALTVDSSMSTVRPTPLLLSLVYLDVRYVKSVDIQAFHLMNTRVKLHQLKTNEEGRRGERHNQ